MRTTLSTLLVLIGFTALGQRSLRYQEVNFSVGTMNYGGELTTESDPGTLFREMGGYFAVDYNYYFTPKVGLGIRTGYGWLTADDLNHAYPERGLSFYSDVVEINGQFIYHFRKFGKYYRWNSSTLYFKLAGGATFVHTQYPEDIQFPDIVELYPGTNGGFNLGLGGGAKWRISEKSTFGVELMMNFLFSDLMEGFKFKGNQDNSDSYGGLRLSYSTLIF